MNKVMRPVLWLVLILALGIAVIYLDQSGRLGSVGSNTPSTPTTPQNPNDFNLR
jgi:hypothetical protein